MSPTETLALMIARDAYLEDGNTPRFLAALVAGGIEDGPSSEPGISMHDLLEWQLLHENRDLDRTRRVIAAAEKHATQEREAVSSANHAAMVAELRAKKL